MTNEDFETLEPGDVVLNLASGNTNVIIDVRDGIPTAINPIAVTNPAEWIVVRKGKWLPLDGRASKDATRHTYPHVDDPETRRMIMTDIQTLRAEIRNAPTPRDRTIARGILQGYQKAMHKIFGI